jgi:maleylpyruvate isomerase
MPQLADSRRWVQQGTATFAKTLSELSEAQLREASLLPDWSRAHVVAHTSRNAQGLGRLATWALTGEETLMYPSREFRNMQIEETVEFTDTQLRELFNSTAHDLEHRFDDLDQANAWGNEIRNFQDQQVSADWVVWLRVREVWIHLIDLGAGVTFDDLPDDLQTELLGDVASGMAARDELPSVRFSYGDNTWMFGEGNEVLEASPAALLGWLLGRPQAADVPIANAPQLPRWL